MKHLSFCEFALNSTVAALTGKAPFKLVYGEKVLGLLDHLTGATKYSRVQAAGEMAEEVSQLVNVVNTKLRNRLGKVETCILTLSIVT